MKQLRFFLIFALFGIVSCRESGRIRHYRETSGNDNLGFGGAPAFAGNRSSVVAKLDEPRNDGNGSRSQGEYYGKTKIFILAGQSNMEGKGRVEPKYPDEREVGTLRWLMNNTSDVHFLRALADNSNREGAWVERDDVWVEYRRRRDYVSAPLTAGHGSGSNHIGPELGFGIQIGDALESEVILIKTAYGGQSLAVDFRPPSSGNFTGDAKKRVVGEKYNQMLNEVREAIKSLEESRRIKDGQYTITGFCWHQGWNDGYDVQYYGEYEENLANLIRDVRNDLGVTSLPFVIATTGFSAFRDDPWFRSVFEKVVPAQFAVPKMPEFEDTTRAVDTSPFYREVLESPKDEVFHWNGNSEAYYNIGTAMADAMLELMGSNVR